ncbi:MAG: helix-hairpin-helix domain-containing protein [Thermodesulfobacteriota bacterium]|nr:helix-hairpin-helix domain-containing protein [Thermodesulfobacteriota bacterium]
MNLVKRQIYGAIGIVLVAVFIYAVRDVSQYTYSSGGDAACCEYEKSGIMVKITGDVNYDGIYFLSQRATVCDLFRKVGLDDIAGFKNIDLDRVLHSGDMVICDRTRYLATIGDITAPVRLAFGMPVDLNKATQEELMLVPGIGRKTASKIIRLRKEKKRFSEVDALKRIIREKRYNKIKDYLYVRFLPLDREKLW